METNEMNTSAEASRENFWSLLSDKNYTICIPRIQRDYAQGREEPEPTQIRQAFLRDVFDALENGTEMDINFIYGNIDVDKKGIQRFVPIDGQQRLTTLFLLHWYFASWSGKLDEVNKEILKRFQYETRFITGDFCNRLVSDVEVNLKELAKTNRKLTDVIKDYYWFFSAYEHDATIKAMLIMLQEIHDTVKKLPNRDVIDSFFDVLIDPNGPINFLFLNIADVGLTDEIYIKMNARGKALTRFENFKAQLSGYLSETDETFSREFIGNINGVWSQFFWHEEYRPEVESKEDKHVLRKAIVFDDQVMNLFRFIMTNEFIANVAIDDANTDTKYLVRRMLQSLAKESDFQFVNHLFTDEFRSVPAYKTDKANVDAGVFKFLCKLLNILAKRKLDTGNICFADNTLYGKEFINEENFFRRLIRSVNEKALAYEDQVLLYAEFCFLVKYANDDHSFDKTSELTEWLRFIHNLSKNTLYNGWDDYYRSIRRVRQIIDDGLALDTLSYSATLLKKDYRQGSGYGFVENQVMEECMKSILILGGHEWKAVITEAENSFFGSQIAALLSFSGIWVKYDAEMSDYEANNAESQKLPSADHLLKMIVSDSTYLDAFKSYLRKINLIFDKEALKPEMEKASILRRALLTFGGADSYMLPANKPVSCFLDATDRDTSFRRLFRGDSPKSRGYFKELLDSLDADQDIVPQMQAIIGGMTYDDANRWKKYFIEMPEILDCMYQNKGCTDPSGNYVFKNPKRYICKRSADQILLLEKTMTTSINREYYSYVLYLKAKAKGWKVGYFTTFNEGTEKYLTYTNNLGKVIQVVYAKDEANPTNGYKYIARDSGTILYKGGFDNMLDYIEQTKQ